MLVKRFSAAILALALIIAGCSKDQPIIRPISGWAILYSVNMPSTLDGNNSFAFPAVPGSVHYVLRGATPSDGRLSIRFRYRIEGDGVTQETDCGGQACGSGLVRLMVQRRGDKLTWEYVNYRFWSQPMTLVPGEYTFEIQLDPTLWTNVGGQHDAAGFQALLSDLENVGFTFGGMFAGHGVGLTSGTLRFTLLEFDMK